MSIALTPFARARLFPKDGRRNAILDSTPAEFERYLNQHAPITVLVRDAYRRSAEFWERNANGRLAAAC